MVIGLVVDDGAVSGGILRVARVEDGGQHLVIDLDETQGALGGLCGLRGDDGHLVAHVAHLVLEDQAVIWGSARDTTGRRA